MVKDSFGDVNGDSGGVLYEKNVCATLRKGEAAENIPKALARGLPLLELSHDDGNADKKVVIIGGGPTLNGERMAELDSRNDVLKVVGGSSHRLLDNGVLNSADVAVYNTPGASYASFVEEDHGLEYWLATGCDDALFDKVSGYNVKVWDALFEDVDYAETQELVVGSGSTAPVAALTLLIMQGYKSFEFYGVDGGGFDMILNEYTSYSVEDEHKNIPRSVLDEHVIVDTDRGVMKVATNFWNQLQEMRLIIGEHPECSFTFHGESLNNLVFNQGMEIRSVYSPVQSDKPDSVLG